MEFLLELLAEIAARARPGWVLILAISGGIGWTVYALIPSLAAALPTGLVAFFLLEREWGD